MSSVSGEESPCATCVERQGLCARHRRGILPRLQQVAWWLLIGTNYQKTAFEAMSPEARRVFERKRTKAARRASRLSNIATGRRLALASLTV